MKPKMPYGYLRALLRQFQFTPSMVKNPLSKLSGGERARVAILKLLLEDKDLAKKMGNEGRKFIEETFNWELITKNFIKIAESYLK